jgi:hypothetical protein
MNKTRWALALTIAAVTGAVVANIWFRETVTEALNKVQEKATELAEALGVHGEEMEEK